MSETGRTNQNQTWMGNILKQKTFISSWWSEFVCFPMAFSNGKYSIGGDEKNIFPFLLLCHQTKKHFLGDHWRMVEWGLESDCVNSTRNSILFECIQICIEQKYKFGNKLYFGTEWNVNDETVSIIHLFQIFHSFIHKFLIDSLIHSFIYHHFTMKHPKREIKNVISGTFWYLFGRRFCIEKF